MSLQNLSCQKSFGGWHKRYKHHSDVLDCDMTFAVYLPPQAEQGGKLPVLYWLSGLTCTDENFMQKAGAQRMAAELGMIIVAPDTSPRGPGVPGDPDNAWDFGLGAGFYLNATQEPWSKHYRMHDYVVHELPALVEAHFPASDKRGISGHSMGGHGALVCALRNPGRYQSVSAFSPINNPMDCPWGQKAFSRYLGGRAFEVARMGCLRADQRSLGKTAVAGGPGRSRRLPRHPAQARGLATSRQGRRPSAGAAPAAGL